MARALMEDRLLPYDSSEPQRPVHLSDRAYGYIRISPIDVASRTYSVEAQSIFLREWAIAKKMKLVQIFTDMCTMETPWDKRPALIESLANVSPGDTLVMIDLTRLLGPHINLLHLYKDFNRKKYRFVSARDGFDTHSAFGNFALINMALAFEMLEDVAAAQQEETRQIEELRRQQLAEEPIEPK